MYATIKNLHIAKCIYVCYIVYFSFSATVMEDHNGLGQNKYKCQFYAVWLNVKQRK